MASSNETQHCDNKWTTILFKKGVLNQAFKDNLDLDHFNSHYIFLVKSILVIEHLDVIRETNQSCASGSSDRNLPGPPVSTRLSEKH